MNIGIIGCGNIGMKRAKAFNNSHKVCACTDINKAAAEKLAANFEGCKVFAEWLELLQDSEIDLVIVATTHNYLAKITHAAVKAGKHVLVEKPAGIHAEDLLPIIKLAKENKVCVAVGFNHRYHPALQKAKHLIDAKEIGDLMFIRGRYGHGGRVGYDREWRAKPEISGGGELIDQGMHLIDLSRWFLGEFKTIEGKAVTYYWDMPVDDNAFLTLTTEEGKTAFLQVSCTEWKNLFSFEIYGKKGKLEINGLGGSYGTEKLTFYKMLPQMGPPEVYTWGYPTPDSSWQIEIDQFVNAIKTGASYEATLNDAYQALKVVEKIYERSKHDCYA